MYHDNFIPVNEKMADSRIMILLSRVIDKVKSLEEENVLVVAGRGVRNEKDVEIIILSELKKSRSRNTLGFF